MWQWLTMNCSASTSTVRVRQLPALCLLILAGAAARADVVVTEGTNLRIDIGPDGRIVTDLLGGVWQIPAAGGDARAVRGTVRPARAPRISPDGSALVYESTRSGQPGLWLHDLELATSVPLAAFGNANRSPVWHPDGRRITFASARNEDGFDLWEVDIDTRVRWRLTHTAGDEIDPAWSGDGRHLAWIHVADDRYSLVLRRFGLPDEVILTSEQPLRAPAWRPDGSLLTYLRQDDGGWSMWMTILSEPRLNRPLIEDQDFFIGPVAWRDRQHLLYAADGMIKERAFDAWSSTAVPFTARIDPRNGFRSAQPRKRELPPAAAPATTTIIRAARLFDGTSDVYRRDVDIVIDGGTVAAVEPVGERSGVVVDLGDVTVLPGFIDVYSRLPESADASLGPLLLCFGITTTVADRADADTLDRLWSARDLPGPRLLRAQRIDATDPSKHPWLITMTGSGADAPSLSARVRRWHDRGVPVLADDWQTGVAAGAGWLLGTGSRPASPAGRRYQDVLVAGGGGEVTYVSGLADARTPHIDAIWRSPAAPLISAPRSPGVRLDPLPDLSAAADSVILGSLPNRLPPGIAVHAELKALVAAGLTEAEALRATGSNAAAALGLGAVLGRVAGGVVADLVIVDGDPLADIDDAGKIIAVVRNGRFHSVSGLLDRARAAATVE